MKRRAVDWSRSTRRYCARIIQGKAVVVSKQMDGLDIRHTTRRRISSSPAGLNVYHGPVSPVRIVFPSAMRTKTTAS